MNTRACQFAVRVELDEAVGETDKVPVVAQRRGRRGAKILDCGRSGGRRSGKSSLFCRRERRRLRPAPDPRVKKDAGGRGRQSFE